MSWGMYRTYKKKKYIKCYCQHLNPKYHFYRYRFKCEDNIKMAPSEIC